MARDKLVAAGRGASRPRLGFTLFELILAAAIFALVSGSIILAVGGWYREQSVDECARRVEAILRLARAEACGRSRRIRLAFDAETLAPAILWEPEPLAEPGRFVPHFGQWAHDLPTEELQFLSCRRTGASAVKLLTYSDAEEPASAEGEPLESVTFLPDGSCDSAVIEMTALDGLDPRVGRIEIDGVTGTVTLRILTPLEQEEQEEANAAAEEAL